MFSVVADDLHRAQSPVFAERLLAQPSNATVTVKCTRACYYHTQVLSAVYIHLPASESVTAAGGKSRSFRTLILCDVIAGAEIQCYAKDQRGRKFRKLQRCAALPEIPRNSWFDPDFFKQRRESRISTQFIQTGADAVFPQIRNATVFVFHASGEASKGFIMIA